MKNLKQQCLFWYHNEFKTMSLYLNMVDTVEDSLWHREKNVGIHTDMVVSEYISRCPIEWQKQHVMGFLVCVFHDVGKPISEINKFSEKRGNYKAYHGHELMSARMWEDFYSNKRYFIDMFGLDDHDLYGITWMIEHHLPWSTKDTKKLEIIAQTIKIILTYEYCDIFVNVLLSDAYGRISDESEIKQLEALVWTKSFMSLVDDLEDLPELTDEKIVYIPIGTSGTGKTTYFNTLGPNIEFYSLDDLRLKWYPADDYTNSWILASKDTKFKVKSNAEYIKMINNNKSLYIDNTNLTKKSRNFYTTEARKRGYKIIAIVFPISKNKLKYQQDNRTDKTIHETVYLGMYNNLQQPSYKDFDKVEIFNDIT